MENFHCVFLADWKSVIDVVRAMASMYLAALTKSIPLSGKSIVGASTRATNFRHLQMNLVVVKFCKSLKHIACIVSTYSKGKGFETSTSETQS